MIRIGTKPDQIRTYIAGISGKVDRRPHAAARRPRPGSLGTASAAKQGGAVKRLSAQVKRQQRQIERLRKLVKGG